VAIQSRIINPGHSKLTIHDWIATALRAKSAHKASQ